MSGGRGSREGGTTADKSATIFSLCILIKGIGRGRMSGGRGSREGGGLLLISLLQFSVFVF